MDTGRRPSLDQRRRRLRGGRQPLSRPRGGTGRPAGRRGYLDVGAGLPPPDLVVEIDRSRRSGYKLAPYFRMGVKEAWTSHRKDGVSIWTPDAGVAEGFRSVPASVVLPGLTAAELTPALRPRRPAGAGPAFPAPRPPASPSECSMLPAPDGRREPTGERHRATLRSRGVRRRETLELRIEPRAGPGQGHAGDPRRARARRCRGYRGRHVSRARAPPGSRARGLHPDSQSPSTEVVSDRGPRCRFAQFSISATAWSTDSRAM